MSVLVNREHPPSRAAVVVRAPDGTPIGRWAEDESKLENVPGGLAKSGDMPGGHTELSCSLPRDPNKSYPDLALFSTVELQAAGEEKLWQGTIRQEPEDGERESISVKAVGDKQFLEDDETVVGPGFIDCDLSKWGEPSVGRRLEVINQNALPSAASASLGSQSNGSALPALVFDFTSVESKGAPPNPGAEMWAYGGGVDLAYIGFDQIGDTTTPWTKAVGLSTRGVTEGIVTNRDVTGNYSGQGENTNQWLAATVPGRKYALIQVIYTGTFAGRLTNVQRFQNLKLVGNHGLTLHGTWPEVGLLAEQMIPVIAELAGLKTKGELLEDDGFVIPQAWFSEPATPMSKLVEVTKYGLLDWFVFNDRILQYRKPGAYGRKWLLAPGSGAPKNAGPDANRVFDRLMVTWQDVDGTTKRAQVGPLTDERNAAVAAKRPRGKLLALNGVCTEELAVRTGTRFLEEAQNLAQSGEATISGYVQDSYGIWYPAAYVQPGDWAADPGTQNYRKITSANYSHDSRSTSVSLGAPPEGMGALEARFAAKLIELGLG